MPNIVNYLDIRDSAATPDSTFYANFSTNSGNNTGWAISSSGSNFLTVGVEGQGQVNSEEITGTAVVAVETYFANKYLTIRDSVCLGGTRYAIYSFDLGNNLNWNIDVAAPSPEPVPIEGQGLIGYVSTKTDIFVYIQAYNANSFLDIRDSECLGGTRYATYSVDSGNNVNWIFSTNAGTVLYGIGAVGTVLASGQAIVTLTGVTATGEIGTVDNSGSAEAYPQSVQGTTIVGNVAISGTGVISVSGVTANAILGQPTYAVVTNVFPSGVVATGQVGSVTLTGKAYVYPTGVVGVGIVNIGLVWGIIDDGQTSDWVEIPT